MKQLLTHLSALLTLLLCFTVPVQAQDANSQTFEDETIVEVILGTSDFTKLVAAADAADLIDDLYVGGPYTFFAPSDAAFDKLEDGTFEAWLEPENKDELLDILSYHIIPADQLADEDYLTTGGLENMTAAGIEQIRTLHGAVLNISPGEAGFYINEAAIVQPDIITSNGAIHVIDTVLLPPSEDMTHR